LILAVLLDRRCRDRELLMLLLRPIDFRQPLHNLTSSQPDARHQAQAIIPLLRATTQRHLWVRTRTPGQ
jgi:hypothetical protein